MFATEEQPAMKVRSNTMPLGTPCDVLQTHLLGQRSPVQGKRMTLGDFGTFLSWPSPQLASRTLPRKDLTHVLGTRGGVVRNQDGFEVFYGVKKAARRAKPLKGKALERDGFDRFFGIQAQDRTTGERQAHMQMSAGGNASSRASEVTVQQQQVESQLQARLATPVASPDQSSRFVPVGRSVSDSVMLHYACGYELTNPTCDQAAQADVFGISAVREEEEKEEDEGKELVECVNLGDELRAPAMVPKISQPAASRQAQLVKGFEVFSMCGRPKQGLVPAGVAAFNLATPTPSFEPPPAPGPTFNGA